VIKSDFELHILEGSYISWLDIFVVDWIVVFEAATGVEPTVSVFLWVIPEFS